MAKTLVVLCLLFIVVVLVIYDGVTFAFYCGVIYGELFKVVLIFFKIAEWFTMQMNDWRNTDGLELTRKTIYDIVVLRYLTNYIRNDISSFSIRLRLCRNILPTNICS